MPIHQAFASLPWAEPAVTTLRRSARVAFSWRQTQRLAQRLALTLLFATMPALAEQAGRVIITAGTVQATTDAGRSRALARGDTVDVGDTISTDALGQTQIRFIDGGLVSLRPNSEYHIDEFSFERSQERHAATLRRGALSTLTGGAARKARERYRLSTPVATIGVRGTYYEVALASTGELYLGVSQGAIRVTATRASGSGPGFADLGVGEDYRFALFRPDGSIALLTQRPTLLEAISQPGRGRDGAGRPAARSDTARNERDGKDRDGNDRDGKGSEKPPEHTEGSNRKGPGVLAENAGQAGAGQRDDAGPADGRGRPGAGDAGGAADTMGDNTLDGDQRKLGPGSFPALRPGDGSKPGIGILPGGGPEPASGKGGAKDVPLDSINPVKSTISPLERGDVTLDSLFSRIATRTVMGVVANSTASLSLLPTVHGGVAIIDASGDPAFTFAGDRSGFGGQKLANTAVLYRGEADLVARGRDVAGITDLGFGAYVDGNDGPAIVLRGSDQKPIAQTGSNVLWAIGPAPILRSLNATGRFAIADGQATGSIGGAALTTTNISGGFNVTLDLGNGSISSGNLDVQFDAVAGPPRSFGAALSGNVINGTVNFTLDSAVLRAPAGSGAPDVPAIGAVSGFFVGSGNAFVGAFNLSTATNEAAQGVFAAVPLGL